MMHFAETAFWRGEALELGAEAFVPKANGFPIDPMQGMVLYGPALLAVLLLVTASPWAKASGSKTKKN